LRTFGLYIPRAIASLRRPHSPNWLQSSSGARMARNSLPLCLTADYAVRKRHDLASQRLVLGGRSRADEGCVWRLYAARFWPWGCL